ncbi:MAG: endonuclease/exonuclease/phosphatase family protein [Myxococcales bacterium]|nr:endonuclease/exonuclease/phosphatase family protein [Myxococcales bacterium]
MTAPCRVTVLTLNLWHDSAPADARARVQREAIEALRPDIIGFQEVLRDARSNQAEELLAGMGYEVSFGPVVPFWKRDGLTYGNALASRWPIASTRNVELPTGGGTERRAVLLAELAAPAGALFAACTHFHHREPEIRELQARAALAAFSAFRGERHEGAHPPHLFLGDFNASPDKELSPVFAPAFHDAFAIAGGGPGLTWSTENPYAVVSDPPGVRIDYILVGRGTPLRVLASRVVCREPRDGVYASDHFGVFAELVWTP